MTDGGQIQLHHALLRSCTAESGSDSNNEDHLSISQLVNPEMIQYFVQDVIPDQSLSYVNSGCPQSLNACILDCLSSTSQTILPSISPANFLVQINNIRLHPSSNWLPLSCSGFVWLYEHQRICETLSFTLSKLW